MCLPSSFSEVGVIIMCSQGLVCLSSVIMNKVVAEVPHATKHGVLSVAQLSLWPPLLQAPAYNCMYIIL
jgi:hypothetical protein